MARIDVFKGLFDAAGFGLEVGPSYNPVCRKSDGYRVEIADYTPAAELRRIHPGADIEEVDYVTGGGPLTAAIPKRRAYDFIIASHVIEHVCDLVQFMLDCTGLLKKDGVLVLAVPDKRHCFDLFQPITSTGDVLQAHLERRTRVLPGRHFDHYANAGLRGSVNTWNEGWDAPARTIHSLDEAIAGFQKAAGSTEYIDGHAWYFVPSSFRIIMRDLYDVGAVELRERGFVDSTGPEFYITLSVNAPGCSVDRMTLLTNTLREMRAVPIP